MHLQQCESIQNMVKLVQYLVDQTFWEIIPLELKKEILGDNSNFNTILSWFKVSNTPWSSYLWFRILV